MYLSRQRYIKKQIEINKSKISESINNQVQGYLISNESLNLLQSKAHQQLSMNKVQSRQIDYHRMQTFLILSNEERKKSFYKKVSQNLSEIFNNQKAKKVFDEKWTHSLKSNIMGLFNQIVIDYYKKNSSIKQHFNQLYTETIQKLMKDQKLSRIQQKFIDPFLSETMRQNNNLDILGTYNRNQIYQCGLKLQKILNSKQTPKSLTNSQYLQYSVLSLLNLSLPHQKYLYNQLLHAPNPKFLYPFRKKGTFISLTHQILVKSNRTDMVGFKYWNYYQYEESDAYEKVRKAAQWQTRIIPLAIILKKKVMKGLQRYMNLIDQKVRFYNNRGFEQDGINLINSYVQLCLQICYNHFRDDVQLEENSAKSSQYPYRDNTNKYQMKQYDYPDYRQNRQSNTSVYLQQQSMYQNQQQNKSSIFKSQKDSQDLTTVLQRVDIGTAFQLDNSNNCKHEKLRYFTIKLTQLYFILLTSCRKGHLRQKFIINFSYNIEKVLQYQNQRKFTQEITSLSLKYLQILTYEQRQLFIYSILERINEQWQNQQSVRVNNQISKIDTEVLEYISFIIQKFGLNDNNDPTKKSSKLQFFYILALNFNQNSYFESKKRLSKVQLTINTTLSNNPIFDTLQTRKLTQQKFRSHLTQLYGKYDLDKKEHQGILAIIDEILTYRIQVSKDIPNIDILEHQQNNSFYCVLINFLEQSQRLDPTKKLLNVVRNYCIKCKKTYMIEVNQMKFKDETKKQARKLITQDISYLVESSISSNPIIAEFSQQILFQYIENISELALYTKILIVFAECITILYKKASIQYQSKAETLKGKHLTSSILIPTDNKIILKRLIKIMIALYSIILKGHCIDDNYMRVKIGYLIKQHSKSAKTPFGWKYLKYLINNFKQDKQFIAKQILTNNSCSWFINENYFQKKIKQMKPEKLLLDKYLLPLHNGDCSIPQLKKLLTNIDLQEQTQFLIIPSNKTNSSFNEIIKDLEMNCQYIQRLKLQQNQSMSNRSRQQIHKKIQQTQNKLYDIISRIKMTYINKISQIQMFSNIFKVCQKYYNSQLLNYTLIKIVPFIYCINQFNERILILISQMLYYVVNQLNKSTKFIYNQFKSDQSNTFDLLLNCFEGLQQYQVKQHSFRYQHLYKEVIYNNKNNTEQKTYKYMVIKFYKQRLYNLKKMFKQLQKFLADHLHVCIGKGFSLTLIVQIFSINFILEDYVIQFLHLQSICYCLTSQLQLVNVLKSSLQKGHTPFQERSLVQDFQMATLKMGLNHFQRKHNFYKQQLLNQTHNIKSLKTKIDFLIQICDYLRNQDFHELKKKRLPKRTDKILQRNKKQKNLFSQIADESGYKKSHTKLINSHNERTSLASQHGQTYEIRKSNANKLQQQQNIQSEIYDPGALRFTLLYLISQQIDKTKSYSFSQLSQIENPYSLAKKKKFINSEMILSTYNQMSQSNILLFNILKIFGVRIDFPEQLSKKLSKKISQKPDHGFPQFLEIFIEQNKSNKQKIKEINFWKSPNVQILFKYLSKDYQDYPYLQQYVTKVLSRLHSEQILFYLPQIFQTLTLKTGEIIYNFLLQYSRNSASFAHQLIWIAKVQSKQQQDPHNKNPRLPGVDKNLQQLQIVAKKLIKDILRQFTKEQKIFFRQVNDFYEQVTAISGIMKPQQTKDIKRDVIRRQVQKIKIPDSAYLPINPIYKVVDIDKESGTPMQSAAKTPFLLTFKCKKYEGPDQDFQNRKKQKKFLELSQFQNELEQIREQQIPHKLPTMSTIVHGSRIPYTSNKRSSDLNSPTNGKTLKNTVSFNPHTTYKNQQISQNDVHFKMQQFSSSDTKSKKDTSLMYKSRDKQSKMKNSSNNNNSNNKSSSSTPLTDVSCIFKVFDDIRQDCLALQVIRLFSQIFQRHDLELKLFSYKTISNRTGQGLDMGGIIEVVPKTVSRDGIGKTNEESLYEFFISNFGPEYNIRFQQARQNFIKSQAAYSIVSYILQIKDRHNGNILINTEQGYLIHIDFGFIFDISPANNLKFQRADFKLTEEMIKIMGGSIDSQPFQLYMNLVIKGFLICRRYAQHIINIIKQMYYSGLPCFLPKSIENLTSRFVLDMSQIQAAQYMKQIIIKAADSFFTNWYDKIQWIQQKIYH